MPRRNLPRVPKRFRAAEERVLDWEEVALPYTAEQARQEAARCLRCRRAACTLACPLGTRANEYVRLVAEGKFEQAAAVLVEHDPFPEICARVCHHPCATACIAGKVDAPIAIRALKRFLLPYLPARPNGHPASPRPELTLAPVAVVGAGPGGLVAAGDLARLGHPVTVFDAMTEPGGLLRWGIPTFRLPRAVVQAVVWEIQALGVVVRPNAFLGRDVTVESLFASGFGAVLLATGAHRSAHLHLPGEHLPGCTTAMELLRAVAAGAQPPIPGKVVVVGGGSAALDAARTARRLGAHEVTVVYRRSAAEMPARPSEVVEAAEEGVQFHYLSSPVAFEQRGGRVRGVRFQAMQLEPVDGGRPRPVPVEGSYWEMPADLVVVAIGQGPQSDGLPAQLRRLVPGGAVEVDEETCTTSMPGVFACGDAAGIEMNVTNAAASGRRAAESIHAYLVPDAPVPRPGAEAAVG
jgi:NADPH-dependent glutamate synthase beta subunit-like oxidoreductase